jgi:hypothetical protein
MGNGFVVIFYCTLLVIFFTLQKIFSLIKMFFDKNFVSLQLNFYFANIINFKKMKKNFLHYVLAAFVGGVVLMTSCAKEEDPPVPMKAEDVNASLLIGTWVNNNNAKDFYKFTTASSGKPDNSYKDGSDWLVGETTEGQEGTEFYYKVNGNKLTMQYPDMEIYIPRYYTFSVLTATKMEYFEADNTLHSFTKK